MEINTVSKNKLLDIIVNQLRMKEQMYSVGWELSHQDMYNATLLINKLNSINKNEQYTYELTKDYTSLKVVLKEHPHLNQIIPISKITKDGIFYEEHDIPNIDLFLTRLNTYKKESQLITEKMLELYNLGELSKWEQIPSILNKYIQELTSYKTLDKWLYLINYFTNKGHFKRIKSFDMLAVSEPTIYSEYELKETLDQVCQGYITYLNESMDLAKFYHLHYRNIYKELSELIYGKEQLINNKETVSTVQFYSSYFNGTTKLNVIYFPHLLTSKYNVYTRSKCSSIHNTNKLNWKEEISTIQDLGTVHIDKDIIEITTPYGIAKIDTNLNTLTYPEKYPINVELPYISEFISLNTYIQ